MKYIIPAVIAISVGLLTLLGYFVATPELLVVRRLLTDWAVVLGGLAILIGILNLIVVNVRRVQSRAKGAIYSVVTVSAALLTLILGASESIKDGSPQLYEPQSISNLLFEGILFSSQAALAALIAVFLVVGAFQLMKTKTDRWAVIFLTAVVIVLVGWLPFAFFGPVNFVRDWMISVPASGGARGILIGVALGTLTIGLRVLTGVERPYKD